MDTYKAYWRMHKAARLLRLGFAVVERIEHTNAGVVAYAGNPEGTETFKFWVSKPGQPQGSRLQVYCREGYDHPFVSGNGSTFVVNKGTVVLLPQPKKRGGKSFPVVSWDDYRRAIKMLDASRQREKSAHPRKGEHIWPEPPPLPPRT